MTRKVASRGGSATGTTSRSGGRTTNKPARAGSRASGSAKAKKRRGGGAALKEDHFLKKAAEIRDLWNDADASDVTRRYAIATKCREVCENAAYGKGAVSKLAEHTGRTMTTIYDYARVAERWPDSDGFAEVAADKDGGKPLPWSILVEIAREENDERRQHLLAETKKHGWGVKELKEARSKPPESQEDGQNADQDEGNGGQAVARSVAKKKKGNTENQQHPAPNQSDDHQFDHEAAGGSDVEADPAEDSPSAGRLSAAIDRFSDALDHVAKLKNSVAMEIPRAGPDDLQDGLLKLKDVKKTVGDLHTAVDTWIRQASNQ
jgi:hypothetical protein